MFHGQGYFEEKERPPPRGGDAPEAMASTTGGPRPRWNVAGLLPIRGTVEGPDHSRRGGGENIYPGRELEELRSAIPSGRGASR